MVDEASTSGYKSSQHDEGIMFKGIGEITMSSSRETQDDMLKADKKEADGDIKEIAAKQELKVSKNIQVSAGDLVD